LGTAYLLLVSVLLQELSINIFTATILNVVVASHSVRRRHIILCCVALGETLPLLEHRRQQADHIKISKEVLNEHFLILCFEVVQGHSLRSYLRLHLGGACILDQPVHIASVDLLLDHGDVVQEQLL
jgi:hypothetical protein